VSRPGDLDALGQLRIEDSPLGAALRPAHLYDREVLLANEVLRLRTLLPESCPSCHGSATVANLPCPVCLLGIERAARALLDKLKATEKASRPVFEMAYCHGLKYVGPNYKAEAEALEAAIAHPDDGEAVIWNFKRNVEGELMACWPTTVHSEQDEPVAWIRSVVSYVDGDPEYDVEVSAGTVRPGPDWHPLYSAPRVDAQETLTEAMIDAPRGFLLYYGQGGSQPRTEATRLNCESYKRGSTECWPDWAKTGDTGITKAGAAILIYTMMRAARAALSAEGGEG
jgi:hypothetical protein